MKTLPLNVTPARGKVLRAIHSADKGNVHMNDLGGRSVDRLRVVRDLVDLGLVLRSESSYLSLTDAGRAALNASK